MPGYVMEMSTVRISLMKKTVTVSCVHHPSTLVLMTPRCACSQRNSAMGKGTVRMGQMKATFVVLLVQSHLLLSRHQTLLVYSHLLIIIVLIHSIYSLQMRLFALKLTYNFQSLNGLINYTKYDREFLKATEKTQTMHLAVTELCWCYFSASCLQFHS